MGVLRFQRPRLSKSSLLKKVVEGKTLETYDLTFRSTLNPPGKDNILGLLNAWCVSSIVVLLLLFLNKKDLNDLSLCR